MATARLGHPVAFVGTVGDDGDGAEILAGLRSEGVDVSGVSTAPGAASAASVVIVDASRSSRAIVNRPPPAVRLSSRATRLLASARWVHVDQAGWGPVREWSQQATRHARLSIDAGNPVGGFDPTGVHLYVPTISALRRRYGDLPRALLLERAVHEGAELVVATDGDHGSCALGLDQPLVEVDAVPAPIRSTLGAGDVFHGALLAAIGHDLPIADGLRYANLAAAGSCRGLDGRSTIPTHGEVMAVLRAGRDQWPARPVPSPPDASTGGP